MSYEVDFDGLGVALTDDEILNAAKETLTSSLADASLADFIVDTNSVEFDGL